MFSGSWVLKNRKYRVFSWESFFRISKWTKINVQKPICQNTFPKNMRCDHNLFLWSGYQKNNFQFVTINFFIFCGKGL
jgi:hypothetical protein